MKDDFELDHHLQGKFLSTGGPEPQLCNPSSKQILRASAPEVFEVHRSIAAAKAAEFVGIANRRHECLRRQRRTNAVMALCGGEVAMPPSPSLSHPVSL
jgi:hypothetical protein